MPSNFEQAKTDMNLTPQEQNLYQMHLSNLWGDGGVDNAPTPENPRGSRSTLFQTVEKQGDRYFSIPTVWHGKIETESWIRPEDNKEFQVANKTALDNVSKAGWENFPSGKDPQALDDRYLQMHSYMEKDTGDYFAMSGNWN